MAFAILLNGMDCTFAWYQVTNQVHMEDLNDTATLETAAHTALDDAPIDATLSGSATLKLTNGDGNSSYISNGNTYPDGDGTKVGSFTVAVAWYTAQTATTAHGVGSSATNNLTTAKSTAEAQNAYIQITAASDGTVDLTTKDGRVLAYAGNQKVDATVGSALVNTITLTAGPNWYTSDQLDVQVDAGVKALIPETNLDFTLTGGARTRLSAVVVSNAAGFSNFGVVGAALHLRCVVAAGGNSFTWKYRSGGAGTEQSPYVYTDLPTAGKVYYSISGQDCSQASDDLNYAEITNQNMTKDGDTPTITQTLTIAF